MNTERAIGDTFSCDVTFLAVAVGMFGKAAITRTMSGDEPMVTLDADAITERIGRISHAEKKPEPIYHAITSRPEPAQPKWRSYLRERPAS